MIFKLLSSKNEIYKSQIRVSGNFTNPVKIDEPKNLQSVRERLSVNLQLGLVKKGTLSWVYVIYITFFYIAGRW